jgi:hypothetical protein
VNQEKTMPGARTPGVHIEHLITERPKGVLETGVPVFLGLIRTQDLAAYNDRQPIEGEQFVTRQLPRWPGVAIARKRNYLRLPPRPATPAREWPLGDPSSSDPGSYQRAVVAQRPQRPTPPKVLALAGAGGPPGGSPPADIESARAIPEKPQHFTVWPQFQATYGDLAPYGFLSYAVRGFFENGGRICYVQLIAYESGNRLTAVRAGLETLAAYDEYDLVCAPDLMWAPDGGVADDLLQAQVEVLHHCDAAGERFAILDALPGAGDEDVLLQRGELYSENAALYYPWVYMADGPAANGGVLPPCGHVAGVFARTDVRVGVHKAPANEVLEGVVNLSAHLTDAQQGPLNEAGVNCLRAFPRRGIRVWGARTLSNTPVWQYVNARRVFLTATRWIERNLAHTAFEPHSPQLWAQIVRDLTAYFTDLYERGALFGLAAQDAFYVKCDAETNPPADREVGRVIAEIGLRPAAPAEMIIIRIIHGPGGARIVGPGS